MDEVIIVKAYFDGFDKFNNKRWIIHLNNGRTITHRSSDFEEWLMKIKPPLIPYSKTTGKV